MLQMRKERNVFSSIQMKCNACVKQNERRWRILPYAYGVSRKRTRLTVYRWQWQASEVSYVRFHIKIYNINRLDGCVYIYIQLSSWHGQEKIPNTKCLSRATTIPFLAFYFRQLYLLNVLCLRHFWLFANFFCAGWLATTWNHPHSRAHTHTHTVYHETFSASFQCNSI